MGLEDIAPIVAYIPGLELDNHDGRLHRGALSRPVDR